LDEVERKSSPREEMDLSVLVLPPAGRLDHQEAPRERNNPDGFNGCKKRQSARMDSKDIGEKHLNGFTREINNRSKHKSTER
jgi:hypothetical protein